VRVPFRQGIIRYPYSGSLQNFLQINGSYINLNAANGQTEVTLAHRGTNYLHIENSTVTNAWGPFTASTDQWLYWDIDLLTGARTFGITLVEPVFSATEPTSPVADLHWFDLTNNFMNVYSGGSFSEVVRVFAAKFDGNVTFSPVAAGLTNLPYAGTQVGLNISNFSGRIIFDNLGSVITRENSELFTTEDQFFAAGAQINAVRLESNVHYVEASETLGAWTVVKYTTGGLVTPAEYGDTGSSTIAIVLQDTAVGEVAATIIQGVVKSSIWTWPTIGTELWVSTNGLLVDVDPSISDPLTYPVKQVPVARVLSTTEIIFEQGLGGIGRQGVKGDDGLDGGSAWGTIAGTLSDQTDLQAELNGKADNSHTQAATSVTFSAAGNIASANVQSAIEELDTEKVAVAGSTMTGLLILSGDPSNVLGAVTKQYADAIDNAKVAIAGDTMTGLLTLSGDPSTSLQAATKQYVDNLLGGSDLGDLSDVTITSPSQSQALVYAGSPAIWINGDIIASTVPVTPFGGSPTGIQSTNVQDALEELNADIIANTAGLQPYDLAGQVVGLPDAGATVFRFLSVRDFTIPTSGSLAMADVASTGSAVFDVDVNNTTEMSITFATSATGTVTMIGSPAVDLIINTGDVITIVAPDPQDATLSDIEMTLFGYIDPLYVAPVPDFTPGVEGFTITEGNVAFDFGYSDTTDHTGMGSVAPTTTSGPFDLKAAYIQNLGIYFNIRISGNHAEAAITQVELVGYETVTTAGDLISHSYDAGDDYTWWQWTVAGAHWNGSGTEDINITFS